MLSYEVASDVSIDTGNGSLIMCHCKLKEGPAPARGAAGAAPAAELVSSDRFRDGGCVKN